MKLRRSISALVLFLLAGGFLLSTGRKATGRNATGRSATVEAANGSPASPTGGVLRGDPARPIARTRAPADAQADRAAHAPAKGAAVFLQLFAHVIPHTIAEFEVGGMTLRIFNIQIFQLLSVVLMFAVFGLVRRGLSLAADGGNPGWIARVFAGFVLWIRDEMVLPVLGEKDGKAFLPYFLFVFFFVCFMNLLGLLPHGLTATACIFVTGALAATTLVFMIGGGMIVQGPAAFWKNLVPHGMPGWLVPLMFVVELIGLAVKPFALMIRLFANMMAGHLVVLSFMGLIFYFAGEIGLGAYGVAIPSVGLAVFIMIIEGFVALLQAYIFTYLSILFVGMSLHPEH